MEYLKDLGYNRLTLVVGSDRIDEISKKSDYYCESLGLEYFKIESSGVRTQSNDISGISGTKLRQYVKDDDYENFNKYFMSKTLSKSVYEILKKRINGECDENARDIL